MKIRQKFILGFTCIALSASLVGYFSINVSRKVLRNSIVQNSPVLAEQLLDSASKHTYDHIENLQLYSKDPILVEAVERSNQEFEESNGVLGYIGIKDMQYFSASKTPPPPFVQERSRNELAEDLKVRVVFYEKKYGYPLLEEIVVTNKFGAAVAQTGRKIDYRQNDKPYWQTAKTEGIFVGNVEYDESKAVYSNDIAVRIEDENGDFAGVITAVLNIQESINVIKKAKRNLENGILEFKLCTNDHRIIYATEDFEFLAQLPDDKLGEGKELVSYASTKRSKGLGWNLIMEHDAEQLLAPIAKLSNRITIISGLVMVLAILMGVFISAAIAKPIIELASVAKQIGEGDLDARIDVKSKDEMGQLAASFAKMKDYLNDKIKDLNREVNFRDRAERELVSQNKFLYNILESLTYPREPLGSGICNW